MQNLYHLIDNKIAAEWEQTDTIGMLQQLGVLPGYESNYTDCH